jgi:hypothetical protein
MTLSHIGGNSVGERIRPARSRTCRFAPDSAAAEGEASGRWPRCALVLYRLEPRGYRLPYALRLPGCAAALLSGCEQAWRRAAPVAGTGILCSRVSCAHLINARAPQTGPTPDAPTRRRRSVMHAYVLYMRHPRSPRRSCQSFQSPSLLRDRGLSVCGYLILH